MVGEHMYIFVGHQILKKKINFNQKQKRKYIKKCLKLKYQYSIKFNDNKAIKISIHSKIKTNKKLHK